MYLLFLRLHYKYCNMAMDFLDIKPYCKYFKRYDYFNRKILNLIIRHHYKNAFSIYYLYYNSYWFGGYIDITDIVDGDKFLQKYQDIKLLT